VGYTPEFHFLFRLTLSRDNLTCRGEDTRFAEDQWLLVCVGVEILLQLACGYEN